GWGITSYVQRRYRHELPSTSLIVQLAGGTLEAVTAQHVAQAAMQNDQIALEILQHVVYWIAEAICHLIALLCPRRIVIGGGVSLMGKQLIFDPLRSRVAERVFRPFAGCYDIVPAALGEEVVVHGALALARRRFVEASRNDG